MNPACRCSMLTAEFGSPGESEALFLGELLGTLIGLVDEDHSATHSEERVSLRAGEGPSTKQGLLLPKQGSPSFSDAVLGAGKRNTLQNNKTNQAQSEIQSIQR